MPEQYYQPPIMGNIKTWMKNNFYEERCSIQQKKRPCIHFSVMPGITKPTLLNLNSLEFMETIEAVVCDALEIKYCDLRLHYKDRTKTILFARQLFFYLCLKHGKMTLTRIGMRFNKTHATVLNAKKIILKWMNNDMDKRMLIQAIEKKAMDRLSSMPIYTISTHR